MGALSQLEKLKVVLTMNAARKNFIPKIRISESLTISTIQTEVSLFHFVSPGGLRAEVYYFFCFTWKSLGINDRKIMMSLRLE